MRIIEPSYEILQLGGPQEVLKAIEVAGRVCYKSEDKITADSAGKFVRMLRDRGHEAMIEHASMTVKFICSRVVSHELIRHRLASWAMESQRYCAYSKEQFGKEITVILPCFFDTGMGGHSNSLVFQEWKTSCEHSERAYFNLLDMGAKPEEAREVLPNSTKTEVVMTANMREWRHFFKLRTAKTAYGPMREIVCPLLIYMQSVLPEIFEDIVAYE